MVGRLKVAPPRAVLDEPKKPLEVAELLKGDNFEKAFSQLVREYARRNVPGVLRSSWTPKLDSRVDLGSTKRRLSSRLNTSSRDPLRGFYLPRPINIVVYRLRKKFSRVRRKMKQ